MLARALGRDMDEGRHLANIVASVRIVTIFLTAAASGLIGISPNDSPVIATLMIVFAIALIGRACSLWADEMFQAYEVNHFSFRQAKIFRTSEVLLGIAVALLTKDVVWVASTHPLIWVAQGARGLFLVIKHLQPLAPRWNWSYIRSAADRRHSPGTRKHFRCTYDPRWSHFVQKLQCSLRTGGKPRRQCPGTDDSRQSVCGIEKSCITRSQSPGETRATGFI